jgi:hypothetical protein
MDVPGGFAPADCGNPGTISLKKVSNQVKIPEVRSWISERLCNPLIPVAGMAPDPRQSGHILFGGAIVAGRSLGSVLYHQISLLLQTLGEVPAKEMFTMNPITERD